MTDCFEIIPAIDILNGKCVRLTQGNYDNAEQFSDNPLEIAKKWVDCGAKRIHIVDLDGAKKGTPTNKKIILNIAKHTNVRIQVGGGIRSRDTIDEYLNSGISYVILGTKAFQDPAFLDKALEKYNENLILGLDLKNNMIALSGWSKTIEINLNKLASDPRLNQIIFTDISKDGMLTGPNLTLIKQIANTFKSNIIVSGGISTLDDIISLINIKNEGLSNISGVILGKSLYKETIDLRSALKIAENHSK